MLLGGCSVAPRVSTAEVPVRSALLDPASVAMNQAAPDTFKVLFETTAGDFVVEVVREWAPLGADRFYNLVRNDYYNTVRFFRVVPGFVVQFGLHGIPPISAAWREARIPDDSVRASNQRGFVTFATSGPETRTVQVFINLVDNTRLDAQGFAPFGRVTGGMDTVESLYAGYGDAPPRGQGPEQGRIQSEGNFYLQNEFPQLDHIVRARIISP
jgi:peptidyl-prolyl cis-trans isomerase A (cyclophilin A)